eukprot:6246706-Pyramimonas_sp.AAC.1
MSFQAAARSRKDAVACSSGARVSGTTTDFRILSRRPDMAPNSTKKRSKPGSDCRKCFTIRTVSSAYARTRMSLISNS